MRRVAHVDGSDITSTRKRNSRLVLAGAAAIVVIAAVFAPSAPARPLLDENFDGAGLSDRWSRCYFWRPSHCTNEWNAEEQVYVPANVVVRNGVLNLIAKRERTVGHLHNGTPHSLPYSSGMISSAGRFSFRYGYVEMRARVPAGQGLWPAFWLLPESRRWPPEIDVMELLGSEPDRVHQTLHPADGSSMTSFETTGVRYSEGWHTFAMDWRPDSLVFFVDGVERGRVTAGVPSEPMYLIANLAVGGRWPGSPTDVTAMPATFSVDHIRVWEKRPSR